MRILVGLSGGIDSTYAAYKLINEGHEVEGAVIVMHEYTELDSAREAAQSLGIKLHVIDAVDRFLAVKDNFVNEYSRGRTPNPCVICNPLVKFRALLDYALEHGFDKIATGHYATVVTRIEQGRTLYTLKRARDERKDQTYMLHRLGRDVLSRLVFPLSNELKDEIKRKSAQIGLSAVERKESQEICFIPDNDYAAYIEGIKGTFPEGDFVLEDGSVIGRHKGIVRYTVGQRKGLGVSYGERIFVNSINAEKNEIVLSTEGSFTDKVSVSDLVYSGMCDPKKGEKREAAVKLRYLASPIPASVEFDGEGGAIITLARPERAVTPGQSAVIYDGDELLAGGFID